MMHDQPISLPSLDAHAHLDPDRSPDELKECGAVLAMTLSLNEAARVIGRENPQLIWGAGCHPRKLKAQEAFDPDRLTELLEQTALLGEIGLDGGFAVPMELQLRTFRQALQIASLTPRLISIHAYQATGLVLEELRRQPVIAPILHWWTGNVQETRQAVALGCYFSIHSAVARNSKFRLHVPLARVLVESDHGWNDPPAAIPYRIRWVEYLVADQYHLEVDQLRRQTWQNLARVVQETGTETLLPGSFLAILNRVSE